ncbi:hypothetical protein JCM1840_007509 [Sporobolomyces johnsonii]
MVRLDADLLARTPSYLNPLHDRELDLRGHKIPAIENLGVTKDQLESLDLTDNAITSVSNFPLLRRLHQLLLANNPVRTVSPSVATSLPNLRTLILTNSSVPKDSLAVLGDVLAKCRKLEMLSLKGAPVEQAEHYKEWIVFRCKKLRSLDFDRIKQKDRDHAASLFLNPDGTPTALHTAFLAAAASGAAAPSLVNGAGGAKTFEPGVEPAAAAASGKAGRLLTKEEKERVRQAIEGAESVEEIRRLQRMLAQGFVPTEKDLRDLERKKAGGAYRLAFRSLPYAAPTSALFPSSPLHFTHTAPLFTLRCFPSPRLRSAKLPPRAPSPLSERHTPPPSLNATTSPSASPFLSPSELRARTTALKDSRKPYTMDLTILASKKKVHKSAVIRERCKRRLREAVRLAVVRGARADGQEEGRVRLEEEDVRALGPRKWLLPGYHYIASITLEIYRAPLPNLVEDVRKALKALRKKAENGILAQQLSKIPSPPPDPVLDEDQAAKLETQRRRR